MPGGGIHGRFFAVLVLMMSVTACDGDLLNPSLLTENGSDIARIFDQAMVVLPHGHGLKPVVGKLSSETIRDHLSALPPRSRYPMILYMHGCTGFSGLAPPRAFAKAGFAVIAPNSFARRFYPLQFRPSEKTGGDNIFVYGSICNSYAI